MRHGYCLLLLTALVFAQLANAAEPPVVADGTPPTPAAAKEASAALPNAAAPAAIHTPEQIQTWIAQLDANEFSLRESAMRQLAKAGLPAIDVLAAGTQALSLEQSHRCLSLLEHALLAEDPTVVEAAESALERVASRRVTWFGQRAESALNDSRLQRQKMTLAKLKELGAEFDTIAGDDGEIIQLEMLLRSGNWRGEDKDLRLLRALPSMRRVSFFGAVIGDQHVAELSELKQVARLELYGTKLGNDSLTALKAALPNAEIDRRNGGMLGISGDPSSVGGCLVNTVQPDSAAQAAGVEPGDVIHKIDGRAVESFRDLTSIIAERYNGDKVKLEIERNAERLTKEATLGEWKPEHLKLNSRGGTIIINNGQRIIIGR